jgi:hypothetical protein
LTLGIVGWVLCGVGSILAVILGFIAHAQIRDAHGRQKGAGMATAGIVLGFVAIALIALAVVISVATGSSQS